MLGSIAPSVTSNQAAAPSSAEDNAANESKAKAKVKVDPNNPTTSLQVRLNDGSRLVMMMDPLSTPY